MEVWNIWREFSGFFAVTGILKTSGNKGRVINYHQGADSKTVCKTSAQQKQCPFSKQPNREQDCCMNFPAKSLAARLIPDTPRADLYTHTHKIFWETSFLQSLLHLPAGLPAGPGDPASVWRERASTYLVLLPSLPSPSLPLFPSGWQDSSGRACNQFAGSSRSHRKDAEAQPEGAPLQAAGDRGPGSGQNQHHQALCPPELLPPLPGHHRGGLCFEGAELGCWDCGTAAALGYCGWVQRRTPCPIIYRKKIQNVDPNSFVLI